MNDVTNTQPKMNDNVYALRAMAEAVGDKGSEPGRRSFCQCLNDAANEIEALRAALEPFAKKARAFDWRKGAIYKTFEGEQFPDDEAKVMLDTIEVAKAKPNQLSIGHFRRARDVLANAKE